MRSEQYLHDRFGEACYEDCGWNDQSGDGAEANAELARERIRGFPRYTEHGQQWLGSWNDDVVRGQHGDIPGHVVLAEGGGGK